MSKRFSDPITLFTGLPGHGKTLMAITYAIEARKEGQRVYQLGIKDCNPAVAELFDPVARSPEWYRETETGPNKPVERWRELTPGSILILDEAQDFLPVRGPGRPPVWISELARLRHYGVQIWLITQDVRNLDSFVRRLIGAHVHIERKMGMRSAVVFRWEHVTEDTRDYHARKSASKSAFKHDKKNYQFYTSSTQHLVKRKIPWQLYLIVPTVIGMVVAIFFVVRMVTGHSTIPSFSGKVPGVEGAGLSLDGSPSVVLTTKAYLSRLSPRIPGAMWSAPLFDSRKAVSAPELYCVASEVHGCQCYTEQITRVSIPLVDCFRVSRDGLYNPFRAPARGEVRSGVSSRSLADSPVPVGATVVKSSTDSSVGAKGVQSDNTDWPRPDFSYKVPFPGVSH